MAVSLLSLGAWAVALVSHLSGGAHASSPPLLGGGGRHRFRSVPEVEGAMYAAIDKETCTLLLHAHGEIGCGTKFRKGIAEPLQSLEAAEDEIHGRRVVLLTYRLLDAFLGRLASDPSAAANVAGILLRAPSEGADGEAVLPESFSPAERAPMAPLAPYANSSYEWNPRGSGLGMRRLPFPLFLVPSSTGAALDALAQDNVARGYRGALHVAEMAVIMHASGAGSSSACLAASGGRGTCEPLGGYSAWAAYPPLPVAPPGGTPETDGKKLVLAVAPMDSAGVFRSRLAGAESPISGLVAMMVAMRALTLLPPAVAPPGRVLFAALAGEPWGLLGSRRLAGDLASGKLPGLHAEDVSAVLELGALGRSGEGGGKAPSLFAHTGRSSDGQPHPGARDVLAALQRAGVAAGSPVAAASAGLPGTPPGPLWSFLRLDPSAPGAVLADFDSSFSSPYFGGELDALGNCTAGGCRGRPSREELTAAVLAAGDVAARALFELAGGDGAAWPHPPGGAEGARALGVSLVECLLDEGEGMGCPLAASLMSPGKEQPVGRGSGTRRVHLRSALLRGSGTRRVHLRSALLRGSGTRRVHLRSALLDGAGAHILSLPAAPSCAGSLRRGAARVVARLRPGRLPQRLRAGGAGHGAGRAHAPLQRARQLHGGAQHHLHLSVVERLSQHGRDVRGMAPGAGGKHRWRAGVVRGGVCRIPAGRAPGARLEEGLVEAPSLWKRGRVDGGGDALHGEQLGCRRCAREPPSLPLKRDAPKPGAYGNLNRRRPEVARVNLRP